MPPMIEVICPHGDKAPVSQYEALMYGCSLAFWLSVRNYKIYDNFAMKRMKVGTLRKPTYSFTGA